MQAKTTNHGSSTHCLKAEIEEVNLTSGWTKSGYIKMAGRAVQSNDKRTSVVIFENIDELDEFVGYLGVLRSKLAVHEKARAEREREQFENNINKELLELNKLVMELDKR